MRGKAAPSSVAVMPCRITPAYAGKSRAVIGGGHALQDHPRVCGEKTLAGLLHITAEGSPPRMRGKVQLQPGQPAALGITPAYAGKSKNLPALVCGNGDHPRVCGEKRKDFETANRKKGSPPRMRGKVQSHRVDAVFVGITPAYAGKSPSFCSSGFSVWDHPRVCGEKQSIILL